MPPEVEGDNFGMAIPSLTLVASGLLIVAFAIVVIAASDLTWIRASTRVLRNRADLDRFSRAINRQRWASLLVIFLLISAAAVALVGQLGGWCHLEDLPLTLGAGVPLMFVKWWMKYAERRFKAIPAANEKLRARWERLLQEWEERPIPDWG